MPAPAPRDVGDYFDFWVQTFGNPASYDGPALNVNSVGDVPSSSWYTPRHYWHPMSLEELARGPDRRNGPSRDVPWRVVAVKSEGKTAGMEVIDGRGDRYVLKLDPPGYIELTSGAEVISTKILHALGYNVPENYVVRFRRDMLVPGDDAVMKASGGVAPVTERRIDSLLADAPRYADGSYRGLASLYLEGDPVGPFLYYGTRPDDANDVFPHEGRRELRGLRIIAAWINHTDARAGNTIDVVVQEGGRRYVRHYLIDFGSTLGAGPVGPKKRWDGYEYILDGVAVLRRMLTFGRAGSGWAAMEVPDLDAVGTIDVRHFDPVEWRPQYPNAAFLQADPGDAFWAAKQVANLSEEAIRAIVATADYTDEAVEERLADVLVGRRDKVARAYLRYGGGLDRFEVRHDSLFFHDLPARHGLSSEDRLRHVVWRPFDNDTGRLGDVLAMDRFTGTRLSIPHSEDEFLSGEIRTPEGGTTRVYVRGVDGARRVVGLERYQAPTSRPAPGRAHPLLRPVESLY